MRVAVDEHRPQRAGAVQDGVADACRRSAGRRGPPPAARRAARPRRRAARRRSPRRAPAPASCSHSARVSSAAASAARRCSARSDSRRVAAHWATVRGPTSTSAWRIELTSWRRRARGGVQEAQHAQAERGVAAQRPLDLVDVRAAHRLTALRTVGSARAGQRPRRAPPRGGRSGSPAGAARRPRSTAAASAAVSTFSARITTSRPASRRACSAKPSMPSARTSSFTCVAMSTQRGRRPSAQAKSSSAISKPSRRSVGEPVEQQRRRRTWSSSSSSTTSAGGKRQRIDGEQELAAHVDPHRLAGGHLVEAGRPGTSTTSTDAVARAPPPSEGVALAAEQELVRVHPAARPRGSADARPA